MAARIPRAGRERGRGMYQFFVEPGQIKGQNVVITGNDVNHIKNVLRMKPGEEISVSNGQDGREYRCTLLSLEEERVLCRILSVKEGSTELPVRVHLFQCLPKGDKMELIIQKAVELGAYEIIPVASRRCVVKLEEKKARAKVERWQAIAEAAAKQSRRSIIPKVLQILSFEKALQKASEADIRLIPYELAQEEGNADMRHTRELLEEIRPGQDVAVFIGPEGGFEKEEIRKAMGAGVEPITLGKRILRTETAGLAVMAWIVYRMEE